jgi:hypothetical protein
MKAMPPSTPREGGETQTPKRAGQTDQEEQHKQQPRAYNQAREVNQVHQERASATTEDSKTSPYQGGKKGPCQEKKEKRKHQRR